MRTGKEERAENKLCMILIGEDRTNRYKVICAAAIFAVTVFGVSSAHAETFADVMFNFIRVNYVETLALLTVIVGIDAYKVTMARRALG